MNDLVRILNLIWRVPLGALMGGVGYGIVKSIVIWLIGNYGTFLQPRDVALIGNICPPIVPIGCLIWAFWEFIRPPSPPQNPFLPPEGQ